jgi:hypothetical protein
VANALTDLLDVGRAVHGCRVDWCGRGTDLSTGGAARARQSPVSRRRVRDRRWLFESGTITKPPYEQVFERIRAEFLEMPGMRLTPAQVVRLAGVDRSICLSVLDDLVRAGFLCTSENGSYGRLSDAPTARARRTREQWAHTTPTPAILRAS